MPKDQRSSAVELASSHLITTCATFAAIATFVGIGSEIVPNSLGLDPGALVDHAGLVTAFILNIAVIIFGWRRSRDLGVALAANEEAERRAHESAYSDHVTGLANRRKLVRTLERVLDAPRPQGVLILLDLDHFKKVNDTYGHQAGDAVLIETCRMVMSSLRAEDILSRYGGEEFAISARGIDIAAASQLAERLRRNAGRTIQFERHQIPVTASLGCAALSELGTNQSPEALIAIADRRLYLAKTGGRNRVVSTG